MVGIKPRFVIGGSVLLSVAMALFAAGEEDVLLGETGPARNEHPAVASPPAIVDGQILQFESTAAPPYASTNCPQWPAYQPRYSSRMQRCQARYWGYPEEFCEPPLGAMVNDHYRAQRARGYAARMALYQYDFVRAGNELTARGKVQLRNIARWLPLNEFPLFVEADPESPELDELRRQSVWRELSEHQVVIPYERIVVGRPGVRGLDAGDALLIDRSRLGLTASRGVSASGGSGSTSSGANGVFGSTER